MKQNGWLHMHHGVLTLGVIIMVLSAGCVTTPPSENPGWPEPAPPAVTLQPGDVIKILFPYWPELEAEQMIRPDGKVALQLVGDVEVQGLTPDGLRTALLERYADKLKNPEITVVVTQYVSQRVYVGGEVRTPGLIPIQGRLTVLEAIMQAGGFNKGTAQMRNVVLIREREGKRFAKSLDLRKALEKPESTAVYLEPYDVVYVPRTTIDKVDQWVDQYINQIIPRSVYWNLTYDLNQQDFDSDSRNFTIQAVPGL
ncbi:MAG TPA: polysaccharide biosynthesis/export family protein [Candidatus Hydrogenedentes bacterium]|nr:polysaccharide biosynthesis/export family protein [Candidatus Hydrogenedentota bacterium]